MGQTVTKYVQGGLCKPGKGSKKRPYNTLSDAEADKSWNVLVVLPSNVPLDGGIKLRSGTKLVGDGPDPTNFVLARNIPTITNSSDAQHDGHGIVMNGNSIVENIYIRDTWASGINLDNGKNVHVKNVLITGHNQGAAVSNFSLPNGDFIEAAGIHGHPRKDGEILLEKVIIRNNNTGGAVVIVPNRGAKCQLTIKNCEIADIISRIRGNNQPILAVNDGIFAAACGVGTTLNTVIKQSHLHDFRALTLSQKQNRGIVCAAFDGAQGTTQIKECTFTKIANGNQNKNWHILNQAYVDTNRMSADIRSTMKLSVYSCTFEEPIQNSLIAVSALENQTTNSFSEWAIKKSKVINLSDAFCSTINSDGEEKGHIIDNFVTGAHGFYVTATQDSLSPVVNPRRISIINIKDNLYLGGNNFAAIAIISNKDGLSNPWNKLRLYIKDNCFNGQNTGFAAFLSKDMGTVGAGNASIYAHNNSIIGYNFDIMDVHANVNYHVQKNWWGPSNPCLSNNDCLNSQTCIKGFCTGPDNINNLGNGIIRAQKPLIHSIKCRHQCQTD